MISNTAVDLPFSGRLNDRIRQARLALKWSRAELSRRVGVVPSAAAQWEHPNGTSPSVEHLISIAIATDVAFEWLATGRGLPRSSAPLEASALSPSAIAIDLFEEQMLTLARRIPYKHREAFSRYFLLVYPADICEPPRDLRRLQLLREWSHEQVEQVFP